MTITGTAVSALTGTTINRNALLQHLVNEFGKLATETGQVTTDSLAGYGPAIDRALRRLGVAETDLATAELDDADGPAAFALAEYYALLRFQRALAVRGDIDGASVIGPRSQVFQQVRDMLADAKLACEALGYAMTETTRAAALQVW